MLGCGAHEMRMMWLARQATASLSSGCYMIGGGSSIAVTSISIVATVADTVATYVVVATTTAIGQRTTTAD